VRVIALCAGTWNALPFVLSPRPKAVEGKKERRKEGKKERRKEGERKEAKKEGRKKEDGRRKTEEGRRETRSTEPHPIAARRSRLAI